MAKPYKRKKDRNRRDAKWIFKYVDEHGVRRTCTGYTDKQATQELADKLQLEANKRRDGLIDDNEIRLAEHRRRPIAEHIADYDAALRAKGSSDRHIKQTISYIEEAVGALSWETLGHIRADAFVGLLGDLRRGKNLSHRSLNARIIAVKAFATWCINHHRMTINPMSTVQKFNEAADRRKLRRPVDISVLNHLLAATESGPDRRGVSGSDRAMLYRVLAATGFRIGEARSLTPRSLQLDGSEPAIVVEAAYSKRRREDCQPIPVALAAELGLWANGRERDRPLWKIPDKVNLRWLKPDLRRARAHWIREVGDPGERRDRRESVYLKSEADDRRVIDFHAFRHGYITQLTSNCSNVPAAQRLARHSSPDLTLKTYSHVSLADERAVLDQAFPEAPPSQDEPVRQPLALTGTDGPVGRAPNTHHTGRSSTQSGAPRCTNTGASDDVSSGPFGSRNYGVSAPSCPLVHDHSQSAPRRTRTFNPLIKSQLLCQLS